MDGVVGSSSGVLQPGSGSGDLTPAHVDVGGVLTGITGTFVLGGKTSDYEYSGGTFTQVLPPLWQGV